MNGLPQNLLHKSILLGYRRLLTNYVEKLGRICGTKTLGPQTRFYQVFTIAASKPMNVLHYLVLIHSCHFRPSCFTKQSFEKNTSRVCDFDT